MSYAIFQADPKAYQGKILAIVSPMYEGQLPSGTPVGSMSGLIYQNMPSCLREKYVVPAQVFQEQDYARKYYLIARYGLTEKHISLLATANPSTLLLLQNIINTHAAELITEIRRTHPRRAIELDALLLQQGQLCFKAIWPGLRIVSTWTDGCCRYQIPALKKIIPAHTKILEIGYLASEFRGGIVLDPE